MSIFQTVKKARVNRTTFNLSHEKKLSMAMGRLYPTYIQECVPGDKFNVSAEHMIRFAPMIAPVMHQIEAYMHFFFVPNRLLWSQWEDFITGEAAVNAPVLGLVPGPTYEKTFWDYLGVPTDQTGLSQSIEINTLPLRAYKLIWNEYYRDQNLQTELDITDDANEYQIRPRAWEKDYFTSCLPWAQKGTAASLSITSYPSMKVPATGHASGVAAGDIKLASSTNPDGSRNVQDASSNDLELQTIEAAIGEIEINQLRTAVRVQKWLERNARAGSRYVEHLLAHWGVRSSDARLDRPEYLGGGKSQVMISEVLNMTGSETANNHPLGTMGGHGLGVGASNRASKYCEEHGYIMGIMSIVPKPAYYQGVARNLTRKDKFDYYFPEFARLGEQEVLNQEIYVQDSQTLNEGTFGYQSRYAEYKYVPNTIHGDMRSEDLEHWHMARKFASAPALNDTFIRCNPTTRIWALVEQDEYDPLWVTVYNTVFAKRPMPYYSDPETV